MCYSEKVRNKKKDYSYSMEDKQPGRKKEREVKETKDFHSRVFPLHFHT